MKLNEIIEEIKNCKSVKELSALWNRLADLADAGELKLTSGEYLYTCDVFNQKEEFLNDPCYEG